MSCIHSVNYLVNKYYAESSLSAKHCVSTGDIAMNKKKKTKSQLT